MIRWVQQPSQFPGVCAVLPTVGGRHPAGYFDTGQTNPATAERTYVSVAAVVMMAEMLGFRRGQAPDTARVRRLEARVAELEADVAARDEQLAAVHTLKRGGMVAAAKTGPKAKAAA